MVLPLFGSANLIHPGLCPNRSSNTASRHRQEAIGVTTPCTPRKSQPESYPPLGSEKQASLEGLLNGPSNMASRHRLKSDRSSGAVHLSQVAGGSHRPTPEEKRNSVRGHVRTDPGCSLCKRNERAWKDHLSWE